jgi:hypothetical protein
MPELATLEDLFFRLTEGARGDERGDPASGQAGRGEPAGIA